MNRFAYPLFVVLSACVLLLSAAPTLKAGPPPSDVTVINTSDDPVPVTGTVSTEAIDNRTPVSRTVILAASVGEREDRQTLYTVPTGKRLIITGQSAATIANGVKPSVTLRGTGGGSFSAILPQISRGWFDGQGEIFEGSSTVTLMVDAGHSVEGRLWLSSVVPTNGGARVELGFTGYLVDAP